MKLLYKKMLPLYVLATTLLFCFSSISSKTILIHLEGLVFRRDLNRAIIAKTRRKSTVATKISSYADFNPHDMFMTVLHKACPICNFDKCKTVKDVNFAPHFINTFSNPSKPLDFSASKTLKVLFENIEKIRTPTPNPLDKIIDCFSRLCLCGTNDLQETNVQISPSAAQFIKAFTSDDIHALKLVAEVLFNENYSNITGGLSINLPMFNIIKQLKAKNHTIYLVGECCELWLAYYKKHCPELMKYVDGILSLTSDNVIAKKTDTTLISPRKSTIKDDSKKLKRFLSAHSLDASSETIFIHDESMSDEGLSIGIDRIKIPKQLLALGKEQELTRLLSQELGKMGVFS